MPVAGDHLLHQYLYLDTIEALISENSRVEPPLRDLMRDVGGVSTCYVRQDDIGGR